MWVRFVFRIDKTFLIIIISTIHKTFSPNLFLFVKSNSEKTIFIKSSLRAIWWSNLPKNNMQLERIWKLHAVFIFQIWKLKTLKKLSILKSEKTFRRSILCWFWIYISFLFCECILSKKGWISYANMSHELSFSNF